MSMYSIQKIGPENFELLVPLMKDCFGMDANIDYFHWKYIQNPAGSFIGFVAIETTTNEVGAYYGVIPQKFLVEGIEKTIYHACDAMTHSNHRRRGLFKMLVMECSKYLKEYEELFVIGFGGAQSTPGFLNFGWKHVFDFKYYFKPAIASRLIFLRSYAEDDFIQDNNIRNLESFFKKINLSSNSINSTRTARHIRWRTANPNYFYKTICYKQQEGIEGYVIYYIQNNKLILFDFLFSSSKAEKALLWLLSKEVNRHGYRGIISFCQQKGHQAITLRKNGFISNPFKRGPLSEKTHFIFFAEEKVMEKYTAPDKWDITAYDHDAL